MAPGSSDRVVPQVHTAPVTEPCPQAWHGGLPAGLLRECKYLARHRGQHRTADGTLSWSGKLAPDELTRAAELRAAQ